MGDTSADFTGTWLGAEPPFLSVDLFLAVPHSWWWTRNLMPAPRPILVLASPSFVFTGVLPPRARSVRCGGGRRSGAVAVFCFHVLSSFLFYRLQSLLPAGMWRRWRRLLLGNAQDPRWAMLAMFCSSWPQLLSWLLATPRSGGFSAWPTCTDLSLQPGWPGPGGSRSPIY